MNKNYLIIATILVFSVLIMHNNIAQVSPEWKQHDMSYPAPPTVDPGKVSTQDNVGIAPSDAIVLFDGKNLDQWRSMDGSPADWKIEHGLLVAEKGSGGGIRTIQSFGNIQLHVEWVTPNPPDGVGQRRGNNGIQIMGKYEVQILDSYKSATFPDGQAAAIYSQFPPRVNASRPPGEWQTYDIIFRAPSFDVNGNVKKKAIITVLHNGILVHDHVELKGVHSWMGKIKYEAHPEKLPLVLQREPCTPVKFRNIWIRELNQLPIPNPIAIPEISLSLQVLDDYTGTYNMQNGRTFVVKRENNLLVINLFGSKRLFYASSELDFFAKDIDFAFRMKLDNDGKVIGMIFRFIDEEVEGIKEK
ncbi:MAG: DUF1080 domain-containing protein [Bacteroidales bacterium]|nr:DUF1080 domain-containing protein [Bacteroidales bacterium]MCF8390619.1 DUF1080 domain-containing protein [Bacteroidales bacterium]